MDKLNYPHLYSQPKIDNYDDLQKEYMKHAQIKDYYKKIDYSTPIKEIEPLAPLDSNFFSKNPSLIESKQQQPPQYINNYSREKELEKERNRQKQLEYQNFLKQQIEDKKRRKQQEEASRRQEELKYEQKFNMQLHQNQMRNSNGANNKLNKETKMEAMKELLNDHPNLEGILKKINLPNTQSTSNPTNELIKSNNNMIPSNERLNVNVSNQLYSNINDYNDINVNKSYYTNPNININQQLPRDNNNNNNNDYSMYYNNEHNNNIHQLRTPQHQQQQKQYIQSPQRMNYSSPNVLNDIALAQQMNNINMGSIPLTNVSMSNNNICRISNNMLEQQHQSQYNRPTTPIYNNNCAIPSVAMSSPNVNISAMMNNVNNGYNTNVSSANYYQPVQPPQMSNPYQYPQILDKMLDFVLQEQVKIINDYKETIEQLKNERDQAIYLNRANEEKIQALQRIQDKQAMIENKFGYSPFDQQYQDTLEEKLNHMMERSDVNMNMNIKKNNNNSNNDIMDYNGQHPGIINYKSKYEERFEQTGDNFKGSLMGSTKFVKQTGQKKLLETWINDDEVNMNLDEEFKYHNNNNNNVNAKYNMYNNNSKFHSNNNNNYHNVNNIPTNVNINDISEIVKKDNKSDSGDDDVNNNYIDDLNINKSIQQELKPKQNVNVNVIKNKIMLNKDNNVDNYNIDDNVNIDEHNQHNDNNIKLNNNNNNNGKSDNFVIENNNNDNNQFNIEQQDQSDKDDDLCIISKHSLNRSDNKPKDNGYITSSDEGDEDEDDKHNESIKGELIINNNNVTHTKDNEEQIPEVIDNQQDDINEVKQNTKHIAVNRSNMIMGEFNNVNNNSNFYGPIRLSNNSEHKNEDDEEDIPIEIETENDNTEDHYQIPLNNSINKINQSDNDGGVNNNNTYKSNNESTINSRIILLPREQIHTDSIRRNPFTFANTLKQKLNQNESNINNTNNNINTDNINTTLPNNNNNNSNLHNISTIKNNNNNNDIFLDEDDIEEDAPHFHNPKEQSQIISQNDPQNNNNNSLQQSQNKSNAELLKRMTYFDDDDDSGTLEPSSKLIKSNARFSNKVRYPRGVTSKDINNLNSIFDKFKKKKQDQRTSQDDYEQSLNSFSKLNATLDNNNPNNTNIINNNIDNNDNNGSLMNESLNTFNNNLNENNYYNFKEDDEILQKVNKLTKVAIDEIGQSQLSVFKNPNEKHPH